MDIRDVSCDRNECLQRSVQLFAGSCDRQIAKLYLKMDKTAILEFLPPHRHLQIFWGKSGDFWQTLWDKFIDFAGEIESKLRRTFNYTTFFSF